MVDRIGADLWVVQHGTRGPFAEISRLPANLEHRFRAVPGVRSTRSFVSHNVQREHQGRPLRMNVHGLAWPEDKGEWVNLIGARNSMIAGLLLQQALLQGAIGFGIAWYLGGWIFPKFPRRVLVTPEDLRALAGVVAIISVVSSLLGIWKAMRVEPNTVLF